MTERTPEVREVIVPEREAEVERTPGGLGPQLRELPVRSLVPVRLWKNRDTAGLLNNKLFSGEVTKWREDEEVEVVVNDAEVNE